MSARPNILLLLADQLSLQALSNGFAHTPHLDRLAGEGVRFLHSYCPAPVCGPARASIVTGVHPSQHGLIYNHDERFIEDDAHRLPTFADCLREEGYGAFWIGKWHAQEFYPSQAKRVHGFDYLPVDLVAEGALGLEMDARATRRATDFLACPPDKPFFLAVSWHNPHDICYWISGKRQQALRPVTDSGALPPLPANFNISQDEPEFWQICRERTHYGPELQQTKHWTQTQWRQYLRAYARLVEQLDGEVGAVLDALDRSGSAEDTLVVFTSDHGEAMAAHRLVVKLGLYEEMAAVPLLARWPGRIPAGERCVTHVASGLDIFPTICQIAGTSVPLHVQGQSMLPQLLNPAAPGRSHAIIELAPDPQNIAMQAVGIANARYKYMRFSCGNPREALYDLDRDPGETQNLACNSAHTFVLTYFRALLANHQIW